MIVGLNEALNLQNDRSGSGMFGQQSFNVIFSGSKIWGKDSVGTRSSTLFAVWLFHFTIQATIVKMCSSKLWSGVLKKFTAASAGLLFQICKKTLLKSWTSEWLIIIDFYPAYLTVWCAEHTKNVCNPTNFFFCFAQISGKQMRVLGCILLSKRCIIHCHKWRLFYELIDHLLLGKSCSKRHLQ